MDKVVVKGYVPLRRGLIPHLKFMSSSEVKLFDAYLLLANHRTAICKDPNTKIAGIVGWSERRMSTVRQRLIARHFVIPNRSGLAGVWVNKYPKDKGSAFVHPPKWAVEFMKKHPLDPGTKPQGLKEMTPAKKCRGTPEQNRRGQAGTPAKKCRGPQNKTAGVSDTTTYKPPGSRTGKRCRSKDVKTVFKKGGPTSKNPPPGSVDSINSEARNLNRTRGARGVLDAMKKHKLKRKKEEAEDEIQDQTIHRGRSHRNC